MVILPLVYDSGDLCFGKNTMNQRISPSEHVIVKLLVVSDNIPVNMPQYGKNPCGNGRADL